jgi:uncharacterized DUF497 family protein
MYIKIDFDSVKNEKNIRERGLSFERVGDFDFETAVVRQDVRKAYPESRFVALAFSKPGCMSCVSPRRLTAFGLSVFAKPITER